MKISEAEVLAGRAKSLSAKYYIFNEIDRMTEQYHKIWPSARNVYTSDLILEVHGTVISP